MDIYLIEMVCLKMKIADLIKYLNKFLENLFTTRFSNCFKFSF